MPRILARTIEYRLAVNTVRPNPDELLDKIQKDAEKGRRGSLKIFFGGCAGVGKTFAMLAAAQLLKHQGLDVIVGVVETHGREDTAAQLKGLELLPRKRISYRGRTLQEFDLDAALARKPSLVLVDELAHSNVEGSRHLKRWQDVEELLSSGIDVYTTLNVQHLESLNDVVGQITGIRVMETLPDKVFENADEVILVDLSPDELLRRLKQGKVYMEVQAERAGKNFFRKGNLIALREMALRRTADRVDAQMREYRADQAIQPVWQARERILLCIGPGSEGEQLVRAAARLAASLKADWHAVYVETPQLQRLELEQRDAIFKTLALAQDLGAETVTLSGSSVSQVLHDYAHHRNASKLVIGKSSRSPFFRMLLPSVADELIRGAGDLDIHLVAHPSEIRAEKGPSAEKTSGLHRGRFRLSPRAERVRKRGYLWGIGITTVVTMLGAELLQYLSPTNVVMLYLLGIIFISYRYGRWPGIFVSFLSVATFDYFLIPPQMSFSVSDTEYLLTFSVMLVVALVISNLTSGLRQQAVIATYRERRSRALYELGKELASALTAANIVEVSVPCLSAIFQAKIAILLPDSLDQIRVLSELPAGAAPDLNELLQSADTDIAQWVYDHQEQAGQGTHTLPSSPALYLPLKAPMRTRGVLAMEMQDPNLISSPEQRQLLDTFASQIALALERVHYVEVAQDALISMESERLRNSLLSAISHDLRTPLTSILGITSTLREARLKGDEKLELLETLHEQALRMNNLVINLLDMARLQAGKVQLNRQWQMLEEIVGSSLRSLKQQLTNHLVTVNLPPDLPLLEVDAVLIERVLCNLLDNAAKYTPAGSHIEISAQKKDKEVWVSVADNGPGLPKGREAQLFEKFERGEKESTTPGVGLGLSICKAIIQAHNGKIWATATFPEEQPRSGASFVFSLPIGTPPPMPQVER